MSPRIEFAFRRFVRQKKNAIRSQAALPSVPLSALDLQTRYGHSRRGSGEFGKLLRLGLIMTMLQSYGGRLWDLVQLLLRDSKEYRADPPRKTGQCLLATE